MVPHMSHPHRSRHPDPQSSVPPRLAEVGRHPNRGIAAITVVDPVCHMEFAPELAFVTDVHEGRTFHFCSPACYEQFVADPRFFGRRVEPRSRLRA